jgi:predicted HTH transcriptional regulator
MEKIPSITSTELSNLTKMKIGCIRNEIFKLRTTGLLKRVGSSKTGVWEVSREE